ncbi:MAG: uracil-DNA glycosylase [Vampirovibrionales bacterium]
MSAPWVESLNQAIVACRACERLVDWRERVATEKRKQYQHEVYWGKPVPSFGDPKAKILIVGLAPAAHGANRTGRMFTGDNSGLWLYRALHAAGLANQPNSNHCEDGLTLVNTWITAIGHCAPPQNTLLPQEIAACQPFLLQELRHLTHLKVVVCLGSVALNGLWRTVCASPQLQQQWGIVAMGPKPRFGHLQVSSLGEVTLITSYHPSQQNTFTGKLTEPMFEAVFQHALHHAR